MDKPTIPKKPHETDPAPKKTKTVEYIILYDPESNWTPFSLLSIDELKKYIIEKLESTIPEIVDVDPLCHLDDLFEENENIEVMSNYSNIHLNQQVFNLIADKFRDKEYIFKENNDTLNYTSIDCAYVIAVEEEKSSFEYQQEYNDWLNRFEIYEKELAEYKRLDEVYEAERNREIIQATDMNNALLHVPPKWHLEFEKFIKTAGSKDESFLDFINNTKSGKEALEKAIESQAKGLRERFLV